MRRILTEKGKGNIRFNAYAIIERAIDEGITAGWRRAHKHLDNPSEETIASEIHNAIMLNLTEVIDFDVNG